MAADQDTHDTLDPGRFQSRLFCAGGTGETGRLMATLYCALCRRPVEASRQIGVGTVVFAVLTAGLSLLAVPFYHRRCSICHSAAVFPSAAAAGHGPHGRGVGVAELERRLGHAEEALEAMSTELERVRAERDFYRSLRGPGPPEPGRAPGG